MVRLSTALCAAALVLAPIEAAAAAEAVADLRAFAATAEAEVERLGRRIWSNEAGGRRDRLVHWLPGESHLSLGIGHVIWYPAGARERFHESFPDLLGVPAPARGPAAGLAGVGRAPAPGGPAPSSWRRAPTRACTSCATLWPRPSPIRWPI